MSLERQRLRVSLRLSCLEVVSTRDLFPLQDTRQTKTTLFKICFVESKNQPYMDLLCSRDRPHKSKRRRRSSEAVLLTV